MSREPALLAECRALADAVRPHATLAALHAAPEWAELGPRFEALLGAVRRHAPASPPAPAADPERVRFVQWNIEHGNWYERVEAALRTHADLAGADVIALDEVDLGCARAANRDVTADLAAALGLHGAWGPLFLETTVGRDDDPRMAAGRENEEGLFGNAVLSRWPLGEARVIGLPAPLIAIRHVLPNVLGPVLVIATINLALAIITEATLSFLGVGLPPTEPSLGTLIRIGNNFLFSGEWWMTIFPGVALVLLVLSVNLLGDWLRDALNPRLH